MSLTLFSLNPLPQIISESLKPGTGMEHGVKFLGQVLITSVMLIVNCQYRIAGIQSLLGTIHVQSVAL